MTDVTGREIQVGDIVLYLEGAMGRTNCSYHPAIITKINAKSLRVITATGKYDYINNTFIFESGRAHNLKRSEQQLYIIDEIPKGSHASFRASIIAILKFALKNEKMPSGFICKAL